MGHKRKPLNFGLLPPLDSGRMCSHIDSKIERDLAPLARVLDRALNICKMCYHVGVNKERDKPETEKELYRRTRQKECYLRGALAELVSTETAIRLDLEQTGIPGRPHQLRDSSSPLLHLMLGLRNIEIHVRSGVLTPKTHDVFLGDRERPEIAQGFTQTIWTIEPLESKQLERDLKLANGDLDRAVDWFNWAQHEWGINELLLCATEQYCSEIVEKHLSPQVLTGEFFVHSPHRVRETKA